MSAATDPRSGFDSAPYRGIEVPMPTVADLALIGSAVLNSVCATLQLGHSSPGMTIDYAPDYSTLDDDVSAASMVVRDFVAWSAGREHVAPGARERLEQYVYCTGWWDELGKSMERLIYGDDRGSDGAA